LAYADDAALIYVRKSGASGWLVANLPKRQVCPNELWPDTLDPVLAQPARRARVIEELDRWIVQAPESIQPLLWKAYALDRANLPQKAEHLLQLARTRMARNPDPELKALLGFVLDQRGQGEAGRRQYYHALVLARRLHDRALQAAVIQRLSEVYGRAGHAARAARLEAAARRLAVPIAE
jgi:Flp pilus assembly protein TadD